MSGTKHDQEKPDYSLLSPLALEEIVKVMTFGKRKYTAHNWRGGINNHRLFSAAMRHLWAYWRGENTDPESNLPHLAHAGCCIMMLIENTVLRPKLDDRWSPTTCKDCGANTEPGPGSARCKECWKDKTGV